MLKVSLLRLVLWPESSVSNSLLSFNALSGPINRSKGSMKEVRRKSRSTKKAKAMIGG